MPLPTIGETRTRTALNLEASAGQEDNGQSSGVWPYQPDEGWFIEDWSWSESTQYGKTTKNIGYVQANSEFASAEKIASMYDELIDMAAQEGLDQYKAKVEQRKQEELQARNQVASSHRALIGEVRAKGRGLFQGGSSIKGSVITTEKYYGCTPHSVAETKLELLSAMPSTTFKVITIKNDAGFQVKFYIQRRPGAQWTLESVGPGATWWWWIKGPALYRISFDWDLTSADNYRYYALPANRLSTQPTSSSQGKRYRFKKKSQNELDLYSVPLEVQIVNGVPQEVEGPDVDMQAEQGVDD